MSNTDLDFLQALIDEPDKIPTTRKPRKPKDVRDSDHWFKLEHIIMGTCSRGDDCVGKILYGKGPDRVTAIVNDVEMCRYCFYDGLAYVHSE